MLEGVQLAGSFWEGRFSDEGVLLGGGLACVSDSEGGSGYLIPSGYGHLVADFADFFE